MNEQINGFKLVIKQLILNFKYVFSNGRMLILMTSFILVPMLLGMVLIPFRYAIALYFAIAAIIPASILYISTSFAWRKGTLYKNMMITKNKKYYFYLSSFIAMLITAYAMSIIFILGMSILNSIGVLIFDWLGTWQSKPYEMLSIFNLALVYSLFEFTLVMFGMLFLAQHILNTEKSMYSLVTIILFLMIIYGAVFNNYFAGYWLYSNADGSVDFYYNFDGSLFPSFLFYPTLILFPLFAPSQHLAALKPFIAPYVDNQHVNFFFWYSKDIPAFPTVDEALKTARCWNSLWMIPYVHTLLLASLAIVIGRIKKV